MKKRKKKSRPSAGTEDRKVFSVRIAVKTAEGNANDLIGKECENLIIQNVLRACNGGLTPPPKMCLAAASGKRKIRQQVRRYKEAGKYGARE